MEYGWFTHALLWFIGALTLCTTIGAVGAMFSLGRDYSKD